MIDRIDKLIKDRRIDILTTQKEFIGIKEKLNSAKKVLVQLDEIEKHIDMIDPHIEIMMINGQEAYVQFVTRQP